MKLYTEEQIREAFEAGFKRGYSGYPNTENWTQPKIDEIISQLTPIELPSDEEIGLVALKSNTLNDKFDFYIGAKWMRDKLTNTKEK